MATQTEPKPRRQTGEASLPDNLLEIYMRDARSHDLLTPEEEKRLLEQITEARDAVAAPDHAQLAVEKVPASSDALAGQV